MLHCLLLFAEMMISITQRLWPLHDGCPSWKKYDTGGMTLMEFFFETSFSTTFCIGTHGAHLGDVSNCTIFPALA